MTTCSINFIFWKYYFLTCISAASLADTVYAIYFMYRYFRDFRPGGEIRDGLISKFSWIFHQVISTSIYDYFYSDIK